MIQSGEKCKVFIEKPDGSVLELTSMVESFSISQKVKRIDASDFLGRYRGYIDGPQSTEMEIKLIGIGPLIATTGKSLSDKAKSMNEWKCDYCGKPNKREKETCTGCGAVRSFIYA